MFNLDKYGVISKFLTLLGKKFFNHEYEVLITLIAQQSDQFISESYWIEHALVLSEDKRFYKHRGIDIQSMFRAVWKYISSKKIEGASTITQQLVRVLTSDYERSLRRKWKEIILACMLEQNIDKKTLIYCYLNNAYFGWRMNGIKQTMSRLNINTPINAVSASKLIARLKYPEPHHPDENQSKKIYLRELHIQKLLELYSNEPSRKKS